MQDHTFAKTLHYSMNRKRSSVDIKMNKKIEKENLELQKRSQGIKIIKNYK